ncbi:putative kinase [Podospora fimiseda]|uniref:Kinase n=1 Tax=Podospora fimiseda TaxID=252190 RepID=A0AAN7BM94_9PEZI|nr:putative kinase [Podospora fimiseda]
MAQTPDIPTRFIDDKSPICIPFILSQLESHKQRNPNRPFIIGLNGVQGVGKTTLVRALSNTLQEREGLSTLVLSIDDFYLTHADQLSLAASHPDNALIQYRGEPGTHDLPLLTQFLTSLLNPTFTQPLHIPSYNKSAFSGLGDRNPPSTFQTLSTPPKILILEGWLLGFRSLSASALQEAYSSLESRTLHKHTLSNLEFINSALAKYEPIWNTFDTFVHIDAQNLEWVYDWRLEQEQQLRREKGEVNSMTDEQVVKFVDAYYPAYELYEQGVREGVFKSDESKKGCQLRLVVGRDRRVEDKIII